MKTVAVFLAAALVAGTALSQPADRPARRGDGAPKARRMEMMQKLNLTEDQQAQMRKMRVEFQKKQIQNQARIRLARLDLSQMLSADKPDRSGIEKAIRDISAVQTDGKLARIDHMLAVRAMLTPEQQKIWKEQRMDNRGGRMRQHMRMFRGQNQDLRGEALDFSAPAPDDLDMSALEDPIDLLEDFAVEEEVIVE